MKTKMNKKCVKILTMIICIVSLVIALIVAPSANIYDMEYNDYERIGARFNPALMPVSVDSTQPIPLGTTNAVVEYTQSIQGWLDLYTSSSSYPDQEYYFNKIRINLTMMYSSGTTTVYYVMQIYLDDVNSITYTVHNKNGSRYQWTLWYKTGDTSNSWYMQNGDFFDITLFYVPSALSLLSLQNSTNAVVNLFQLSAIGATDFSKVPQASYSDGYNDSLANAPSDGGYDQGYLDGYDVGFDDGLEEGYADGYSTGVDDGLEEGYANGYEDGWIVGDQEGNIAGYNSGYAVGYTDGETEGYALGYEEGEVYGWQNGFGAGQNDMAETSHTFKEMVFAIFDAPSRLIDSMLNFDIFGINLAGVVKTILTLAIVAVVVVVIIKFVL